MQRRPFQYGPRDLGPANPPPWPQIVMMLMGLVVCFTAGAIGVGYEYIGAVYTRGPCAFICMTGLLFSLSFIEEVETDIYNQKNDEDE